MATLLLDQMWKPFLPVMWLMRAASATRPRSKNCSSVSGRRHIFSFCSKHTNTRTLPDPRNPYKGLDAFRQDDATDFFGREALVATIVAQLRAMLQAEQAVRQAPILPSLERADRANRAPCKLLTATTEKWSAAWQRSMDLPGTHCARGISSGNPGPYSGTAVPRQTDEDDFADLQDDSARALHWYSSRLVKQSGSRVVFIIDQLRNYSPRPLLKKNSAASSNCL